MDCVQCGEELPASAKFCKKCGCKVGAVAPVAASASAPARGLPTAPTPAYTTCPDCGALCKGDARFCNKCGCRFEETPGFEDTRRDLKTPLSAQEEKAILVFGNVQDSNAPAQDRHGERIDTSPAMVIGGANASSVAAPPSLRSAEPGGADRGQDRSASGGLAPTQDKAASAAGVAGVGVAAASVAAGKAAGSSPVSSGAPASARPRASSTARNPMPQAPVPSGGSGKWVALGVVALAVLVGGGAWWWNTQGKQKIAATAPATPAAAPALAAPAAPVVAAPEPAPAALPADTVLAPNETMEPPKPVAPAEAEASAPVTAVIDAPVATPPAAESAPKPVPRKPARKHTLDDLLN